MFIIPNTVNTLQEILDKLKCTFANKVYMYYTQYVYTLKPCSTVANFELYSTYIEILEQKIQNIKYQCEKEEYDNPSVLTETDINSLLDGETYLTDCDNQLLHNIKQLL